MTDASDTTIASPTRRAPAARPLRLGVLLSGGGRTLLNLLDEIRGGRLAAEVAVVVASRDCKGVERARAAGLLVVMNRCMFKEHSRLHREGRL